MLEHLDRRLSGRNQRPARYLSSVPTGGHRLSNLLNGGRDFFMLEGDFLIANSDASDWRCGTLPIGGRNLDPGDERRHPCSQRHDTV